MLEAKLKLLSILSEHTAMRNPGAAPKYQDDYDKSAVAQYTEMFNLLAHDCMNILYPDDELETTGEPDKDLEIGCESNEVSYIEVKRHGATYLNLLLDSNKIEADTHSLLTNLWNKTQTEAPGDE